MNQKQILMLVLAVLTIAAQLWVPLDMTKRYENILQTGERHLFKVEPRDPADPFKGRYVRLTFPIAQGKTKDLKHPSIISQLARKQQVYAIIGKDQAGFVKIEDIQLQRPNHQNFVKIINNYSYQDNYSITLPFNRYYAEESKAPKIESLLWSPSENQNREFYADVRLKDGEGVIAELYIENTPILEYLVNQDQYIKPSSAEN